MIEVARGGAAAASGCLAVGIRAIALFELESAPSDGMAGIVIKRYSGDNGPHKHETYSIPE